MRPAAASSPQGTPARARRSDDPVVRQFVRGEPEARCISTIPRRPLAQALGLRAMIADRRRRSAGARSRPSRRSGTRRASSSTCSATRRASLRRFGLVRAQIHALGNRSLVIITASGLAVGCVLALQMYYTLQPYGSSERWAWW